LLGSRLTSANRETAAVISGLSIYLLTDKNKEAAAVTPVQKETRWEVAKSDPLSGVDTLKIRSVQHINTQQFAADNPGASPNDPDKNKTYNYRTYQSKLDPGWQFKGLNKDGTLRLFKEFELNVNHRASHTGLVETIGKVSDGFRKQADGKIKEIPEGVRKALEEGGYKTVLAPSVIEGLPNLKGQSHPGWTQDFSHIDGTVIAEEKLIVLGETRIDDNESKVKARANQPGHQFGHAFDALGEELQGKYFSATKEFLDIYEQDIKNMSPEDKNNKKDKDGDLTIVGYLTQSDGRGARETFASIFGMLTTGPENPGDDKEIVRLFPRTVDYMKTRILPKYNK